MSRISNIQLLLLIIAFEVGSTTLFALGIGAEQDAWIVLLLKTLYGLGLVWVYTEITKYYPHQNFSEILNDTVGKKIAVPFLLLLSIYFYSQTTYNFFEFGVLIKMTALELTPLTVILYIFVLVIIYILNLGFEVFARTAEILLPYLVLFLVMIYFLTLFTGQFDLSALRPVLGNGIEPILAELPVEIGFPFGEMVVFVMFWHYIKEQQMIRKTALLAVGFSGILLSISMIFMISVLGTELTAISEIPLLEMVLTINIAEIITNLDSIAVFIMFIGGFYKTALHFYAFTLAMTWVMNNKYKKWILIIFGFLLPPITLHRFPGLDIQRWYGLVNSSYIIPLIAFLPALLLLIIFIKERKKSSL